MTRNTINRLHHYKIISTGGIGRLPRSSILLAALLIVMTIVCCSGCAIYSRCPPQSPLPCSYDIAPGAEPRLLVTADGLTLFGQWWLAAPEQPIRAVVLLVHGTNVHSGFYAPWADYLTTHGYAVFGIDLRGWGQSQGYGRRGAVKNSDNYMEDLRLAAAEVKSRFPDLPLFLQGESLGGAVVLYSQMGQVVAAEGLILNAPAVRPSIKFGFFRAPPFLADFTLRFCALPGDIFPNHPLLVPGFVTELFAGAVVENKDVLARYKKDPHVVHRALPVSYLSCLRDLHDQIAIGLPFITVPVIILQGTKDVLVPLSSSEYTMAHLGSADKTLKVYDGMNHATLHDTGREQVWADIVAWLDQRTPNCRSQIYHLYETGEKNGHP